MRRTTRTITVIVFVCLVVGGGLTILSLGTSTGLTFGGGKTVTGIASAKAPLYSQTGWLRNTSPWPVTITKITANSVHTSAPPTVYLLQGSGKTSQGTKPKWVATSESMPYQLIGGSLRYLGFALSPSAGQVGAFSSVTVSFTGPLGFSFHKTFSGAEIAASSPSLPDGILATDPLKDRTSLDGYIGPLRAALASGDPAALAVVMGGDATTADAQALAKSESGYLATDKLAATAVGTAREQRLVFYVTDPTKDGLPPITVTWSQFRWTVDRG
jgi:hypothetical protein